MEEQMKEGFWNGDMPILFKAVEYMMGKSPSIQWWSHPFFGEVRQGILVKNPSTGYQFLIDNLHGDGYYKVTNGGNPRHGHKSVENYELTKEALPEDEWNMIPNWEALKAEHDANMDRIKKDDPEAYERILDILGGMHSKN